MSIRTKSGCFLLRAYDSSMQTETPTDRIMMFAEATLGATGKAAINTKDVFKKGAKIDFMLLSTTTVYAGATATEASLTLYPGQTGVATADVDNTTLPDITVPGASKTIPVLLFAKAQDLV